MAKSHSKKLSDDAFAMLRQKKQELAESGEVLVEDMSDSSVICYLGTFHTIHRAKKEKVRA